jgi:hypothetical protein
LTLPFPTRSFRDDLDPLPLSIGALLVVSLVVQLARPAPAPQNRGPFIAPALPQPLSAAPSPDGREILARPLFSPGRGAGGAGQAASTSLSDYVVAGVAVVGGRGVAIFRGPAGEVLSLHPGDVLLGWRVAEIGRAAVVLQQGDIRRSAPVGAGAGAAPPRPAAP